MERAEQKAPPIYAYPRTRQFLLLAIAENAHLQKPAKVTADAWVRQRNMIGSYFASHSTLQELADIHGAVTNEAIRQIIQRGMDHLWMNCSSETQQLFPFASIPLNKPSSLRTRVARSLTRPGEKSLAKVLQGLEQGQSLQQIRQESNLSSQQICNTRKRLKRFGIELPRQIRNTRENELLAQRLSETTDKESVRTFFGEIRRRFCQVYSRGENPILIVLSNLARSAGYHFRTAAVDDFVECLQAAGIPVYSDIQTIKTGKKRGHTLRYYYVTRPFKKDSLQAFSQSSKLDRYKESPVVQITNLGMATLPNTYALERGGEYRRLSNLLRRIGKTFRTSMLDPTCPVPLYRLLHGSIFYPSNQEEQLKSWVLQLG